ncbi:MAG: LysR family transcriptional regulator [Proteobacteria bacterium]|nr:LysR family transcriptional regulator [Pseudomonadota bacterium]MBU2227686.1 LysR family transcriptional regulator [Pseudomonadota bacterium]MBU2260433.1 LysR family transcriptional regulator [Pseudomonadota bacterium]
MNLNQLKIFYLAAKHGSLSAAADVLCITQPAVTKGIQRLQEHYDIRLFNRFGKKMVLTDAGEALYGIAESIFEMEHQAEESLRDFQQRKKGFIRILSSESFGSYYLPFIINRFSKANPRIRVSVDLLPAEQIVEKTAALGNDLGFISYPVPHNKLFMREILEDSYQIIVPPGHPFALKTVVEPEDLAGQPIIIHEKGSAPRKSTEEFAKKHGVNISIALELSNNEAMKTAVEEGVGIAVITRRVVSKEIRMGTLKAIPLSDPAMTRKFYLIHHKDKYISRPLQSLIDMVDEWASEYRRGLH